MNVIIIINRKLVFWALCTDKGSAAGWLQSWVVKVLRKPFNTRRAHS